MTTRRWQRLYGIPAPGALPAANDFTISLALVALLPLAGVHGGVLPLGLLAAAAIACALPAAAPSAVAIGCIAWAFDNAYFAGTDGILH